MKNVKLLSLLWLFVVLPAFHHAYRVDATRRPTRRRCFLVKCHVWYCVEKLGLPDFLDSKETSEIFFRKALPEGPWQEMIGQVLENCYKNRFPRFTSTCPGQALLHCVVDQMIDFCPVSSTRKDDSCSPVTSVAGLNYMFGQSRYVNLEKNLLKERRPTWFIRTYFNSKCCDLPVIFNTTVLEECGFTSFLKYLDHGPRYTDEQVVEFQNAETTPEGIPVEVTETAPEIESTTSRRQTVFMPFDIPLDTTARPSTAEKTTTATYEDTTSQRFPELNFSGTPIDVPSEEPTDPLDCCEMTQLINPSWRSECNFHLSFVGQDRLTISSRFPDTEAPTTNSSNPVEDIKLVPHSCPNETCVFRRMGIISDTGIFDIDAYIKMLDNFTDTNPAWVNAKARVFTKCVAKHVWRNNNWRYEYYYKGCEINNMLACTLDVLTENCPNRTMSNICNSYYYNVSCQISSSNYVLNRREICFLPELIHRSHLNECGLETLYKVVPVRRYRKKMTFPNSGWCKDSKETTTCMLGKMGVLSKYGFMDYFKMKDRIRQFTIDQVEWAALLDIYLSAVVNIPLYGEHCLSEKKLLNALDAMLMTCPVSKRKNSVQCNKIFKDMTHTPPNNQNVTKRKLDDIMKHYHHVFFMPNQPETANLHQNFIQQKHSRIVKKPVYDFAFLNSKEAPPVRVISLKPEGSTRRPIDPPLIVPPVYLRPEFGRGPLNDGVFRANTFGLPEQTKAHLSTSSSLRPILHTLPGYNSYRNTRRLLPFNRMTIPSFLIPQIF